ncbi:MAG: adenine-specific DNA-methyltransferase [Planctomycetaceae bacterium]|nr:adenine-specific DNA-methyltransferase [Planctomycetaceae bacterium]
MLYQKNRVTIVHGDTLDVLDQVVGDRSVPLIFADPPYNIGKRFSQSLDKWQSESEYVDWCQQWLSICLRKLTPTGSLYLMASTQSMPFFDLFLRERITILSRIVWHYDSSGVQAKNRFGSMYEPILHCVVDAKNYTFNADDILIEAKTGAKRGLIDYRKENPAPYNTLKVPGNAWYYARVRYRMPEYEEHPSQKPEALLERIIKTSSHPGDMVLDPFAGTFTTCAVAQRLNRSSIGIEKEEEYIKIGLRRLDIQKDFGGEILLPPKRNHARRNKEGVKAGMEIVK